MAMYQVTKGEKKNRSYQNFTVCMLISYILGSLCGGRGLDWEGGIIWEWREI